MNDFGPALEMAPTAATGPIAIMPQRIERFVADALDAMPPDAFPDLRVEGSLATIPAKLVAELGDAQVQPGWLIEWLLANMSVQLRLFSQLTRSSSLSLRLETITDDSCTRFHTDAVSYRLLCTYRGPGTEWIDPKALSRQSDGQPLDPSSIRRLERGAVAVIRGNKHATPEQPALVHRSPRIEGTGIVRLLLVIDDAEVRLAASPPKTERAAS